VTATLLDLPNERNTESPKIYFSKTIIDFGVKQQGDTVDVQFSVQNLGKSVLQLKKVFGNCNCIRPGNQHILGSGFLPMIEWEIRKKQ